MAGFGLADADVLLDSIAISRVVGGDFQRDAEVGIGVGGEGRGATLVKG